jgi:hypothetical protein
VPSGLRADQKKSMSSDDDEARHFFKSKGDGELLLVRAWNPTTGELVGWMPTHSLGMTLERLSGQGNLEANEAVTMYLPHRPKSPLTDDAVSLSPDAVSFRGHKWLPVEHDSNVNIVRIGKACFYIKAIEFGESKRHGLGAAAWVQTPE